MKTINKTTFTKGYTPWNKGMRGVCSVEGCNKEHNAKGFCKLHYNRFVRFGVPDLLPLSLRLCSVKGCENKHNAKGFCSLHYGRFVRFGVPDLLPLSLRLCSVKGCENKHQTKGFCKKHLYRVNRYGTHKLPIRLCSIDGCERKHCAKGLCGSHSSILNHKKRMKIDINYSIISWNRNIISRALRDDSKYSSSNILLGMKVDSYKKYIESMWNGGMEWKNRGPWKDLKSWQIDHIIPLNIFNFKIGKNQLIAFHYKNTRPLWSRFHKARPKDGSDISKKDQMALIMKISKDLGISLTSEDVRKLYK